MFVYSIYIGVLYFVIGGVYEGVGGVCDGEDGRRFFRGDGGRVFVLLFGGRSYFF